MRPRKLLATTCSVLVIVALLAACGAKTATPTVVTEVPELVSTDTATLEVVETKAAPTIVPVSAGASAEGAASKGLTCLADAYNGAMNGATVSMTGPFTGSDATKFDNSMNQFENATGIAVEYRGVDNFESSIASQMRLGITPDIIDFPQPGLLGDFFRQGKVIPVTQLVPESWLRENYKQSWLDIATLPGADGAPAIAGIWHHFNGKSLVWYPKKAFDAAGYTVPTTWDELLGLQDQIVAGGDTPWCIGIQSGDATGWPATDWTEDLMLRTASPEDYDKWVTGELKFSSPEVKKAIETFANIWNDDTMVYGGSAKIVTTSFGDAPAPMFLDPPECWLHRQGSFITAVFPKEAQAGVDYDVFYFPPVDPQYGRPFLVGGDIVAANQERPEVCAVMQYFSTGESVKGWLGAGGALGPQNDVQLDWYGDPIDRKIAAMAADATTVRFDGSDLMPGAVGTGSFWKGMADYFSGAEDLDTVLERIDASWPQPSSTGATVGAPETGEIASQLTTLDDATVARIDAMVQTAMVDYAAPGFVLCIVTDDQVLYQKGFGVADIEGDRPMTPGSVSTQFSISKPLTAMAIMQLVEQAKIDLDAPVTTYLPYFTMADPRYQEITVRMLLSHTAGLPEAIARDEPLDPVIDPLEQAVRRLSNQQLVSAPGEQWNYSSWGYSVLGDIIAKVSGESFESYMQQHLLQPLGMAHSTFVAEEVDPDLGVTGYISAEDTRDEVTCDALGAPGCGLFSSCEDMVRLAQLMLNQGELDGTRLLQAESIDAMWTWAIGTPLLGFFGPQYGPPLAGYGLGWYVGEKDGHRLAGHQGMGEGYNTIVQFAPDDGLAVYAMANRFDPETATGLPATFTAFDVLDVLLGLDK